MRRCAWLLLGLASACGAATPPPEDPTDEDDGPVTYAIALRLEEAGPTDDETPQTRVALVRIAPDGERTLEELRVEQGACWAEAGQDPVLVTARCWWAGAGARYEVRREGDVVIARRQDLDEMAEDGAWTEAGRLDVPVSARLQVLAPGHHASLPGDD